MSSQKSYKRTKFHEIAQQHGWTLKQIGERWGVSERQMSRIANHPKQKDIDAINGLPLVITENTNTGADNSKSDIAVIAPDAQHKLMRCAQRINVSTTHYLNYLLDDDIERQEILKFYQDNKIELERIPVQKISKTINQHFEKLSRHSEIANYHCVIETLFEQLLKEKLIHIKVLDGRVAESQRLKIPRIAYYWYGGTLAKYSAMWFGNLDIYLWDEFYSSESEVVLLECQTM